MTSLKIYGLPWCDSPFLSKEIASASCDLMCPMRDEDKTKGASMSLHNSLMFFSPHSSFGQDLEERRSLMMQCYIAEQVCVYRVQL